MSARDIILVQNLCVLVSCADSASILARIVMSFYAILVGDIAAYAKSFHACEKSFHAMVVWRGATHEVRVCYECSYTCEKCNRNTCNICETKSIYTCEMCDELLCDGCERKCYTCNATVCNKCTEESLDGLICLIAMVKTGFIKLV